MLSVDYSVNCDHSLHTTHELVAAVFIALAVALPAAVLLRVRALSNDVGGLASNSMISHRVAAELGVSVESAKEAITSLSNRRAFSFMTAGLASQFLWWEVRNPQHTAPWSQLPSC